MHFTLFDSSIYIAAFRSGVHPAAGPNGLPGGDSIVLSVVVLEELYAGASDRNRNVVEKLEEDFKRIDRVILPTLADWVHAGRLLERVATKYGYEEIGRGRLTNDALIAMSAARLNILVMTTNARDFARLAEFHPFQWRHAIA